LTVTVPNRPAGGRIVLSPREDLVTGGPAEEFEHRLQQLFKAGYRHVVTDLRGVMAIDSAGVRAFVRGLTTAQRIGGSFSLVAPNDRVRAILAATRLDTVLPIFDAVESAVARRPWRRIATTLAGALVVGALVMVGLWLVPGDSAGGRPPAAGGVLGVQSAPVAFHSLAEAFKLVLAAAVGTLVTLVQGRHGTGAPRSRSMVQAQVLLCVSGAMMMIIINGDLARAFGIAGAAAIIRFRTPVEDPKDITVLFLLMGLGMSAGLGAFAVAGMGTLVLCALLFLFDRVLRDEPREMMIEIHAEGREFPAAHVQGVFARNRVLFEPREVSQGKAVAIRYRTTLAHTSSLDDLSEELLAGGTAGIKSVSWEHPKRFE
jgi:anti-anti-sigma factor